MGENKHFDEDNAFFTAGLPCIIMEQKNYIAGSHIFFIKKCSFVDPMCILELQIFTHHILNKSTKERLEC